MSLFDLQGIPEWLVRNRVETESSNPAKEKNQQRIRTRPVQRLKCLFHHKTVDREGQERYEKKNNNNNRRGNEFEDDLLLTVLWMDCFWNCLKII